MINNALYTEGMKKLFVSIAGKAGIRVVFDSSCKVPHADSKGVITLPIPSAENADMFWLWAFHEMGHLMEELEWSYTKLPKLIKMEDQTVMAVANIIMDNLDERNLYGEYEGVDAILDRGRAKTTRQNVEAIKKHAEMLKSDPIKAVIFGCVHQDCRERQDWMGHLVEAIDIPKFPNEFIQHHLEKIHYQRRLKYILQAKDPAKVTAELVKDVLSVIKMDPMRDGDEGDGDGEPGECKACEGTGKGEDGEPCEACGGTGKEPGECKACEGTGKDGKGEPCKACDGSGKEQGDPTSDHSAHKEFGHHDPDGIGTPDAPDWDYDASRMTPEQLESILQAIDQRLLDGQDAPMKRVDPYSRDYVPHKDHKVHETMDREYMRYDSGQAKAIQHALGSSTVSKQISKYLKAMKTESYLYGQKSGKIHGKNVHRVISGAASAGQQPRIFKKKDVSQLKSDSAVQLLLDCSGSMSGSKFAIGAACCVAISETLSNLKIQHEVLGFTETMGLETYVFKRYGTPMTREKMIMSLANSKVSLYNNADGESLHYAAERLLSRPESRKLLVVLSDGHPCGRFRGDGNAYLRHVCKLIEEESPIDLVGIGINTNAVERFYKNHTVVNNPRELDSVLFGVLKNFLT